MRSLLAPTLAAALALAPAAAPATPAGAPSPAAKPVTLKLATLFPEGSVWDQALRRMIADVEKSTSGRVQVRVYPGGVAGDERDIIRKMRIGQLHAASITTSGLSQLDDSFRALEVPMFFADDAELEYVVEATTPMFRERLDGAGYVLLNWGHTGWVRFFSTDPIRTIDDIRSHKLFVWQGSTELEAWWKKNGFQPVPLAMTDALTALQTGMIDVMPSTALASLSLQWFRQAPHMLDERILGMVGATVVSEKQWSKIDEADRRVVLEAAARMEAHLFEVVPRQEQDAIAEMEKRGLTVHSLAASDREPWAAMALSFYEHMKGAGVPREFTDRIEAERARYRGR